MCRGGLGHCTDGGRMNRLLRIAVIVVVISLVTWFMLPASFYTVTGLSVLIGVIVAVLGRRKKSR